MRHFYIVRLVQNSRTKPSSYCQVVPYFWRGCVRLLLCFVGLLEIHREVHSIPRGLLVGMHIEIIRQNQIRRGKQIVIHSHQPTLACLQSQDNHHAMSSDRDSHPALASKKAQLGKNEASPTTSNGILPPWSPPKSLL